MEVDQMEKIVVAVSGFYDPIHIGHIRNFKKAKALGDYLIVFLQTDQHCIQKKGYVFMPYEERKEILESLKSVDKVVKTIDKDLTIAKTLEKYKPNILAKGGDRKETNMPSSELEICKRLNIQIIYGVGGEKIQSSSWLVNRLRKKRNGQK